MIDATPRKLADGSWGAWVPGCSDGTLVPGETLIKITTRSGKSWTATVQGIVQEYRSGSIVRTRKAAGAKPAARRTVSSNGKATAGQISYAASLISRLGTHGWFDFDDCGTQPPTDAELAQMSRKDISALIDELKAEFC